ncbi:hypothetical protein IGI04_040421 [Brassica rapa subsp. trilocularis]|uniref:Uncharacterized protein n=1 Tax=Brassica rapa subsp. trilocularis TaxID=1813537 RepID=A0ABQ7KMT1_BRACM|nr:hypothetical protein IGI04_040421 [Brassica rapa subsp. trilocularis]
MGQIHVQRVLRVKKNVPLPLQPRRLYIVLLEAVFSFPFCPRSSLSLCENIPFSFDLRVYNWKLHIYPPNLTFIFSCRIKINRHYD